MKYSVRRCKGRLLRARSNKNNQFIFLLCDRYGNFIDMPNIPNLTHLTQRELAEFVCTFFKTFFNSYDCFKELSYRWTRLHDELHALQEQAVRQKVTRPLFKKVKIHTILDRACEIALETHIQPEGYSMNLYDQFCKQAQGKGVLQILSYHDFCDIFRIAAIRTKLVMLEYIATLI